MKLKLPVFNKNSANELIKNKIYKKFSYDEFCIYHLEKYENNIDKNNNVFYRSSLTKGIGDDEVVIALDGFNFIQYYYANCLANYLRTKGMKPAILDLSKLSSSFTNYLKKKKYFEHSFQLNYPYLEIKKDLNARFVFIKEMSKFLRNPLKDFSPKTKVISFSPLFSNAFIDLGIENVVNVIYQFTNIEFCLCLDCPNIFISSDILIESSFLGIKDSHFESLKKLDNKNYVGNLLSTNMFDNFTKYIEEKKNNPIFNIVISLSNFKSARTSMYISYLINMFKKNGNLNLFFISENKNDFKYISRNLSYKFNLEHFNLDIERFLESSGTKDHCIEFIYNDNHFYTSLALENLLKKADLYVCDENNFIDIPTIKMVFTKNKKYESKLSASSVLKDFLFVQNMKELKYLFENLINKRDNLYMNLLGQIEAKYKYNFYKGCENISNLSMFSNSSKK